MAEIVNLRQARKKKARAEKAALADANRVKHGTPKSLRDRASAEKAKAESAHEGHRLGDEDR